jgi:hypothetical protein
VALLPLPLPQSHSIPLIRQNLQKPINQKLKYKNFQNTTQIPNKQQNQPAISQLALAQHF